MAPKVGRSRRNEREVRPEATPTPPEELVQIFMNSLHAYHSEASRKVSPCQLSNGDHRHMATSIIGYIKRCELKTRTAARAEAGISLPDGTVPLTRIELPPAGLRLDDKARDKLSSMRMKDFVRFLQELRKAIWKALGIKTPRKRKAVDARGDEESQKRVRMEAGRKQGLGAPSENESNHPQCAEESNLTTAQEDNHDQHHNEGQSGQSQAVEGIQPDKTGTDPGKLEQSNDQDVTTEVTTEPRTSLSEHCAFNKSPTCQTSKTTPTTPNHTASGATHICNHELAHTGSPTTEGKACGVFEDKADEFARHSPEINGAAKPSKDNGESGESLTTPQGAEIASAGVMESTELGSRVQKSSEAVYWSTSESLRVASATESKLSTIEAGHDVHAQEEQAPSRPIRLKLTHFGRPPKPLVQRLLLEQVASQVRCIKAEA